jgi:HK97 family phage prohead protease
MTDIHEKLSEIETAFRVSSPVELRLAGSASAGVVEGYGSTFGGPPDVYGDVVAAGAFAKSLTAHRSAGTMPSMLWSHRPDTLVGRWTDATEDSKGLRLRGQLNLETQAGRDALAHLKAGDLNGLSIGFRVAKGGREFGKDGTAILREVDLLEVSLVALPANTRARVSAVKSIEGPRELEHLLTEAGIPRAAAVKLAAGGWPALAPDPNPATTDFARRLDEAAREIRAITKGR